MTARCICECVINCFYIEVYARDEEEAEEQALDECNGDTADHYECNCECEQGGG